jgi:hypothetical protein
MNQQHFHLGFTTDGTFIKVINEFGIQGYLIGTYAYNRSEHRRDDFWELCNRDTKQGRVAIRVVQRLCARRVQWSVRRGRRLGREAVSYRNPRARRAVQAQDSEFGEDTVVDETVDDVRAFDNHIGELADGVRADNVVARNPVVRNPLLQHVNICGKKHAESVPQLDSFARRGRRARTGCTIWYTSRGRAAARSE